MTLFRLLRIIGLLLVLLVVAGVSLQDAYQATAWEHPLRVTVYPVDGDGSPVTSAWVASLESRHYAAVEAFFRREASR
jgi:hypothetical protein